MTDSEYVPDFGRSVLDGSKRIPVHIPVCYAGEPGYRDNTDCDTPVFIMVYPSGRHIPATDLEWAIVWRLDVAAQSWRVIRASREMHPVRISEPLPFLTNAGPLSYSISPHAASRARKARIGLLSGRQRGNLENIARSHPVRYPGGGWNGQTFVAEILQEAVQRGILDAEQVTRALQEAGERWDTN
ncbi:hypothetical protein OE88DRAFT_1140171 [Heliocybe sulcata]|uniref:Uncharacterized protein n=1 Tax=Heliocybe sulcata TaxID=5364 RepID=A0A5C3N9R9_9AGAM|nr:hypothetical protein OE88DRAFT_1140171 [Heliocybe sulcata]